MKMVDVDKSINDILRSLLTASNKELEDLHFHEFKEYLRWSPKENRKVITNWLEENYQLSHKKRNIKITISIFK